MKEHTVPLLDIMRLEACYESSDQLTKLRRRKRTRSIFGINEQRLVLVVRCWTTEGKGQEIGI